MRGAICTGNVWGAAVVDDGDGHHVTIWRPTPAGVGYGSSEAAESFPRRRRSLMTSVRRHCQLMPLFTSNDELDLWH